MADAKSTDRKGLVAAEGRPRRKGSVGPKSFRGRIVAGILLIIPIAVTAILIRYVYQAALSVGIWLVYWVSQAVFFVFRVDSVVTEIDPNEPGWKDISESISCSTDFLSKSTRSRRLIHFNPLIAHLLPPW